MVLKLSDVIKTFNGKYFRRTIKGIAETLKEDKKIIEKMIIDNPDTFISVNGCKGKMYELKRKLQ